MHIFIFNYWYLIIINNLLCKAICITNLASDSHCHIKSGFNGCKFWTSTMKHGYFLQTGFWLLISISLFILRPLKAKFPCTLFPFETTTCTDKKFCFLFNIWWKFKQLPVLEYFWTWSYQLLKTITVIIIIYCCPIKVKSEWKMPMT